MLLGFHQQTIDKKPLRSVLSGPSRVESIRRGGSMRRLRTLLAILPTLTFATTGFAQTYQGRILGTVTDESGAVVRGARITITNVETGLVRTLDSNEAGDYVAPNMPP